MTEQQGQSTSRIGFKAVQLLRNETLGMGSYGVVCKAKCDDLLCAAKILHPTLIDQSAELRITAQREHRLPIRRFEQECEFMSAIKHPNIVQYLGTHRDPETGLPVLLMELMDDSLTHFLEISQEPIPFHTQVNICHDITKALSFLHSNDIIHRDLSSNNVLLIGNSRVKVTDFGMARLGDINPRAAHITLTMCPGTDAYMPPEATENRPVYTKSIDCFSFGVLIVQTITREFPDPGTRFRTVYVNDPQFPNGIETRASETQRRQNHISLVEPNHPLLPIALSCIRDKEVERPSFQALCQRMEEVKETSRYRESRSQPLMERCTAGRERRGTIESGDEEVETTGQGEQDVGDDPVVKIRGLESEMENLTQVHDQQLESVHALYDYTLSVRQREIERLRGEVSERDSLMREKDKKMESYQKKITMLEKSLSQKESLDQKSPETFSNKLIWSQGKRTPCGVARDTNAVVSRTNMVYFIPSNTQEVHGYNPITNDWLRLPDCTRDGCSLAMLGNTLTKVGGQRNGTPTNTLSRLTEDMKKVKAFPSMPTKRSNAVTVCNEAVLIVAGGEGEDGEYLTTVEVLDLKTLLWSTATSLPEPIACASATICNGCVYILGGSNTLFMPSNAVHTCVLSDLLISCQMRVRSHNDSKALWRRIAIADLPVRLSTCVAFNGQLLAIGGCDTNYNPTTAIYRYNSSTNSWEIISHMTTPRRQCFAVVRRDNVLMVIGGYTSAGYVSTNRTELANIM